MQLKHVIDKLCAKLKEYQTQFMSSNKALMAQEQAQIEQMIN